MQGGTPWLTSLTMRATGSRLTTEVCTRTTLKIGWVGAWIWVREWAGGRGGGSSLTRGKGDGEVGEWMDGQTFRQTDGRTNGQTN